VTYNFFTSRKSPAETGINPIKRPFSSFFRSRIWRTK